MLKIYEKSGGFSAFSFLSKRVIFRNIRRASVYVISLTKKFYRELSTLSTGLYTSLNSLRCNGFINLFHFFPSLETQLSPWFSTALSVYIIQIFRHFHLLHKTAALQNRTAKRSVSAVSRCSAPQKYFVQRCALYKSGERCFFPRRLPGECAAFCSAAAFQSIKKRRRVSGI